MFWLGLAITGSYVPGYTGATIQTSWAVLSLFLPALALWRPIEFTGLHWVLIAWAAIAVASCAWALSGYDSAWGAWQVILFGLAFWLGSGLDNPSELWHGLGYGAIPSALVAIAQALGYSPIMAWNHAFPSGLYYNSMYAGEIFAILALGLFIYHVYWLVPLFIFVTFLTDSHAGMLALGLGFLLIPFRSFYLIAILALAAADYFTFHFRPSDAERLQIWYGALTNLAWFGHGPGSFLSLWFYRDAHTILFPEYTHNDALQLVFEYGVLACIPLSLLAAVATRSSSRDWPIYITFLAMGLVSFPLYTPILAFAGALSAGRLARDWGLHRRYGSARRFDLVLRGLASQSAAGGHRGEALPVVPRA